MVAPSPLGPKLEDAKNLRALYTQVVAAGRESLLTCPMSEVLAAIEDPDVADTLEEYCHLFDVEDLRMFLTDPDAWRSIEPELRRDVIRSIAGYLRRLATAPASQPAGLAASVEEAARTGGFVERAVLEAWAAERGVLPDLTLPATVLERQWPGGDDGSPPVFAELLAPEEPGAPEPRSGPVLAAARLAAWGVLQLRGERLRDAGQPSPSLRARLEGAQDPVVAALARELIRLRSVAPPRAGRPTSGPPIRITLDLAKLELIAEQPQGSWTLWRVVLPARRSPGEAESTCTCGRPAHGCQELGVAIGAALDVLLAPEPHDLVVKLATELRRPSWARALDALDAALPKAVHHSGPRSRLAWRIGLDYDGLTLSPWLEEPAKRGGFRKPRLVRVSKLDTRGDVELLPADRDALDVLRAFEVGTRSFYVESPSEASGAAALRALSTLVDHPRVFQARVGRELGAPVSISRARLVVGARTAADGSILLEVRVGPGGPALTSRAVAELRSSAKAGLAVRFSADRALGQLIELPEAILPALEVVARGAVFPAEARAEVARRLPSFAAHLPIETDPGLELVALDGDPTPFLRIEVLRGEAGPAVRVSVVVRPAPGLPALVPGHGPEDHLAPGPGDRPALVRRPLHEERARAELLAASIGAHEVGYGPTDFTWEHRGDSALTLVRALAARPELHVEWPEGQLRVEGTARSADLELEISDEQDWFDLGGGVTVGEHQLRLAALLEAAREDRRFVRLEGDRWTELDEALSTQLRRIADLAVPGGSPSRTRVSAVAPFVLADLEDQLGRVDASARWSGAITRMRGAAALAVEPPPAFADVLRPYQAEGYRWLARLSSWGLGACLADDMGLGKTIQTLALLTERGPKGPALVVAPTTVGFNWVREMQRFAPSLRPILLRELPGPERGAVLAALRPNDVVISGYGLLAREIDRVAPLELSTLILDEAQAVKNPDTDRARAVLRVRAEFRVALTGTPVENRLSELWSLFRVVCPGLLGSQEHFRRRFAAVVNPDRTAERRAGLSRLIRPFVLRRTKAEVLSELPPKTETDLAVVLSPAERKRYEQARLAAIANLTGIVDQPAQQKRFSVLAALTRLRQLACDPRLVDSRSGPVSSKLAAAVALLEELREEGHRALVFSQFTSLLALLQDALDASGVKYVYLDGATPAARRGALVDEFQSGDATAFLLSLKAGGTGLNLTAADYVVHLDPWWNPAVEDQATDRAHRIGQQRPVTVYRLVSRGTIEEKILAMHAEKRRLFAELLDGAGSAAALSTEELVALISEGASEDLEQEPSSPPALTRALPAPASGLLEDTSPAPTRRVAPGARPRPTGEVTPEPPGRRAAAGVAGGRLDTLAQDLSAFIDFLEVEHQQGRYTEGTLQTYRRELRRFLEAERELGEAEHAGRPVAEVVADYVARKNIGRTSSARSALSSFRAFLAARDGGSTPA